MSKKNIIILSVFVLAILAASVYFLYNNNFFDPLMPEKLLAYFENKNPNISEETFQLFQDRFQEIKEKLQSQPDSFSDWLYLGVLKKGIGDYRGARDIFLYAAKLWPKSSTPFANLADLYAYFLDEPQKAVDSLKAAIVNDPNDYNLYLSLADVYRYKLADGAAKCEQTLLEVAAKFPDNANVIAPVAAYFRDTNQVAKAIEWYEKLAKLLPDNDEVKADLEALRAKK